MAEWRVLIADDEPAARRGVRQLLSGHSTFAVVGECRNGVEVLQALDAAHPDVVFLDIQMPGLSGFDVIRRRTPDRMPIVVFLTAYDEHALKAFEAEALDYLVKPVSQSRFDAAMRRVTRSLKGERAARSGANGSPEPRLIVSTPRGAAVVLAREIDWIEAADNYARIWTGSRSYLLRESMSELEQRIGPSGFARAHRRALVRVDRVRALTTSADGDLVAELATGTRIPVSRRRRPAFVAAVESAARRGVSRGTSGKAAD